jgi:hypothetical protein
MFKNNTSGPSPDHPVAPQPEVELLQRDLEILSNDKHWNFSPQSLKFFSKTPLLGRSQEGLPCVLPAAP